MKLRQPLSFIKSEKNKDFLVKNIYPRKFVNNIYPEMLNLKTVVCEFIKKKSVTDRLISKEIHRGALLLKILLRPTPTRK